MAQEYRTDPGSGQSRDEEKYRQDRSRLTQGFTYPEGFDSILQGNPEFQRLNAQFSAVFPGLTGFNYRAYLTDPSYARKVHNAVGGDPGRQRALDEILRTSGRLLEGTEFDKAGGTIDVEALYAPLRERLGQLTEQQLRAGSAEISRGAAGATEQAQEALAGTGLGRSGVAAQSFSNIASEAAQRQEGFRERVRERGAAAQIEVDRQVAQLKYQEAFTKRGANLEDSRRAAEQQYYLDQLQFTTLLDIATQEDSSFWEDWGPVFESVGTIVSLF